MSNVAQVSYFGKLPSRGDFIRNQNDHQLIALLDRWADANLQSLAQATDWKQRYDETGGIHYAFLGSRSKLAIAGHLRASHDASGRRFPFLTAVRFEVPTPLPFMACSPVALAPVWSELSRNSAAVVLADDPTAPLERVSECAFSGNGLSGHQAGYDHFLDSQTFSSIEAVLNAGRQSGVRAGQVLAAAGLLLQPLLTSQSVSVDRYMAFPLPADPLYRPMVASFWMDAVSSFLGRADYEVAMAIRDQAQPQLVVGFNGADREILAATIAPNLYREQIIAMDQSDWVEEQLKSDYALAKLSTYFDRPDLSLARARTVFRETFLGA